MNDIACDKCGEICSKKDKATYASLLDKGIKEKFANCLCGLCRKTELLERKTRQCPNCNKNIISQTVKGKEKGIQCNWMCKECRGVDLSKPIPKFFTNEQHEVLTGLMLGDGCIQFATDAQENPRLTMVRKSTDIDYMLWIYEIFKEFYGTAPKIRSYLDTRTGETYESCQCISRTSPLFLKYRKKWYPQNDKIVPKDLVLTPLILLIWFLDDGCITSDSPKSLRLKLSTDGFLKKDIEFLRILLQGYLGAQVHMNKNGGNHILNVYSTGVLKFIDIISPIIPYCMNRKITWKNNIDIIKLDMALKSKNIFK